MVYAIGPFLDSNKTKDKSNEDSTHKRASRRIRGITAVASFIMLFDCHIHAHSTLAVLTHSANKVKSFAFVVFREGVGSRRFATHQDGISRVAVSRRMNVHIMVAIPGEGDRMFGFACHGRQRSTIGRNLPDFWADGEIFFQGMDGDSGSEDAKEILNNGFHVASLFALIEKYECFGTRLMLCVVLLAEMPKKEKMRSSLTRSILWM